jgi:tetratricopeptide (TPR) repeat protein
VAATLRWRALLWILLSATAVIFLGVLAFPSLASAYHLEAGGRDLESEESQSAIAHFNRAIAWDSGNAHAYRLLARGYRANGDWFAAVGALTRYAELRPANRLGSVELAELYEEMEAWMESAFQVDLIKLLAAAEISTPGRPIDTPYKKPGGEVWHGYVAEVAFRLPPEADALPTLFMHPRSQVTYTIQLPTEPAVLEFAMGMDPLTADWPGDGVTFQVLVDKERVFFEHLDKEMAGKGWQTRRIRLAPWAGREVALSLLTSAGPDMDLSGDWAGWGAPRVVDVRLFRFEESDPARLAVEAWRDAGYTQAGALDLARSAHAAGRPEEALAWLERAIALEPEIGDAWHELGLWYQRREEWAEAVHAFEQALEVGDFENVGASDPAYYAGVLYQSLLDPPDRQRAWALYDLALTLNQFGTPGRGADCHYRRGDIMRTEGRDVEEYIVAYELAVAMNPRHAWAHARLGYAYYQRDGDVEAAEAKLKEAISLAPESRWMYVMLGDVYRLEGWKEKARAAYEHALEIDPDFVEAQTRLRAIDNSQ